MGILGRLVGALGPDRTLPERVAMFAAAASVGSSFEPGLQPRKTIDQAIATGLISAVTLSAVTVTQSGIESVGRGLTRGRSDNASALARLLFSVGTNVVVGAAAYGLARALPPQEAEKSRRGLLRTAAHGTARVATVGAALSTAIGTIDLLAESAPQTRWVSRIPVALPAGIAISAWKIHRVHTKAAEAHDTTIADVSTRNSVGIAIGVGAGVLALQAGERVIAHGVARGLARIAPAYDVVSNPIGHVVSLAVLGAGMYAGYEYAVRRVENGAAAVEPAYDSPPTSPLVSGGPGSPVSFESLSREGRRFVNMTLTQDEISTVMGEPAVADPIRLFVGLDSASLMEDRVDLLLDEMVRTKAFERKVVCFVSPTGSGYINYVMAESLEYLTRGDCAIVTMQYSLLPSSMSLTRTSLAVDQNRSIMHAISGYMRGMDPAKRPRLVAFGESLGALTMQDIWAHRSVEAMERDFIHSSLYVGTPSATQFAHHWRISPEKIDPQGKLIELDNFGDFLDLPADRQQVIRHVLVSHYDDPIPKFGTNL
ncbi:MAG: alpha/beta-hydrolase family protein, partial [Candidatus Nanopelagicales bacterium]|nr:alpha/beta-hydrolase family protein [Candidatus Nanopelagicales bacterium]